VTEHNRLSFGERGIEVKDSRFLALRVVLGIVGIIKVVFGLTNLVIPTQFHEWVGYASIPPWAVFTARLGGVRFLVLGFGMYLAIQDPPRHRAWIQAMIFVHGMDFRIGLCAWTSTLCPTIFVRSAIVLWLPLILMALLIVLYPREPKQSAEHEG
jgi:hypothetical protein